MKKTKEKEEFQRAKTKAESGTAADICRLANCYDFGIGTRKNNRKAFELYKIAAQKGDSISQYNLSLMYQDGRTFRKNLVRAFYWMAKAAKSDAEAMANLGYMYVRGIGTKSNLKKAVSYYKKAAKCKIPRAFYNLGLMSYSGDGLNQSDKNALKYFKSAEKLKHDACVLEIARIYLDMNSSERNKRMGEIYRSKALKLGFKEAKKL